MDAVQRMRRKARNYGYLTPNSVDEGRIYPDPSDQSKSDLRAGLRPVHCLCTTAVRVALFDHLNINDIRRICGCSSKPKVVRTGPTADLGSSIRCEELCPAVSGG